MKLRPRGKSIKHIELGGFIVDFFADNKHLAGNCAKISTVSGNFAMKVTGWPYAYMLESTKRGKDDNIHGFCALMYVVADGAFRDNDFANKLIDAVNDYRERIEAQGAAKAGDVTEADDAADAELMSAASRYGSLSKKERKSEIEAGRDAFRDILNEDDDDTSEKS